jgi:ribose transport system substrate-binding protein
MRRGFILLFMLVVALGLAVAACGGDDDTAAPAEPPAAAEPPAEPPAPAPAPEEDTITLGFFSVVGNTYAEAMWEGAQEAAAANGAEAVFFDAPGFDPAAQFAAIQDAITSGNFDALIINPMDSVGVQPAIQDAAAAGLPVVAVNTNIGPDFYTTEPQIPEVSAAVLTPAGTAATALAAAMVKACEGIDPCEVVYLLGISGYAFDEINREELTAAADANDHIDLIATPEVGYLAEPAIGAMADVLLANPNVSVMVAAGDQPAAGGEQAIEDAGLAGQIAIIASGASEPGVEAVRDGRWFGVATFAPFDMGVISVEQAVKLVRGEALDETGTDPVEALGLPPLLDQDNKDDWADFVGQWTG